MQASPMVLIFSSPRSRASASNSDTRLLSEATIRSAGRPAPRRVKPTMSAKDADVRVTIGDRTSRLLQACRDRRRKDVEQQLLRSLPFGVERATLPIQLLTAADRLTEQPHRREQRYIR